MNAIPELNLADYLSPDPAVSSRFVQALGQAYEEVGFVAITGHGISEQLIGNLYKYVQQFFSLPAPQKGLYEIPGLAGQRGYTSFGKEHAKGFAAPDLKEFFQFGQVVEDADPVAAEYPANVVVSEVPAFTPTLLQAYRAFEQTGKILLKAIASYLGLEPG